MYKTISRNLQRWTRNSNKITKIWRKREPYLPMPLPNWAELFPALKKDGRQSRQNGKTKPKLILRKREGETR